jgi:creatinine amidohydrolase
VLADVVASLEEQGIPRLAIVNGHGGNDFKAVIRELQPRTKVLIVMLNWWAILDDKQYFDTPGDHAGELETSVMMHLEPELVLPLSEAGKGELKRFTVRALREGWAWTPRAWTRATSDTGVGDPSAATAEKGARYFEAITRKIAGFFTELARTHSEDLYEK